MGCIVRPDLCPIAEWAIARLQAEATYQLEVMQAASSTANNHEHSPSDENPPSSLADASPNDSKDSARLIGRYHCTSRNRHGHMTVTTEDVSFKQDLTKDRSWRLRYDQIKAIQKVASPHSQIHPQLALPKPSNPDLSQTSLWHEYGHY
jgi:hypothetical protein